MIFEINIRNHFRLMTFHIIGSSLMVIALYFLHFEPRIMKIFFIIWIVYTMPAIYLHLEYYFKNRGHKLIFLDEKFIVKSNNGEEKQCNFEDVQKVVLYKSASLDKGGMQLSAIEAYHYARIFTKQGHEFIITCLLAPNVEELIKQIKGVRYERKKMLFASLYL